jgi:tRNA threonylcarbamoyladenosine biosynthesis protein TsaB
MKLGDDQSSHSNTLLRDIHELLEQTHHSIQDISLIGAAIGPGSFTGLRIGLASAKALAATLQSASIGVPTLHAVARAAGPSSMSVALLPAGRGELFAQMLSVMKTGLVKEMDQPAHLPPDQLLNRYADQMQLRWCGEGAQVWRDQIQKWASSKGIPFVEATLDGADEATGWTLAPPEPMLAPHVAALAFNSFLEGEAGAPNDLRALYVRPSDAELKKHVEHPTGS